MALGPPYPIRPSVLPLVAEVGDVAPPPSPLFSPCGDAVAVGEVLQVPYAEDEWSAEDLAAFFGVEFCGRVHLTRSLIGDSCVHDCLEQNSGNSGVVC